jgi:recombination protein RecA
MTSIAVIRAQVENRVAGALTSYQLPEPQTVPTGITALDDRTGGLPKRALTQICAPQNASVGRTTLLVSIMAQLTHRRECCALIDATDSFDPSSSAAAGVDLSRVLWVRCGKGRCLKPLEQAFKAADVLVQNGGFGLITLDLGSIDEQSIRRVPLTTWFRFARVVEKMPTALLVLTSYPAAKSCAAMTLVLTDSQNAWANTKTIHHARMFSQVFSEVEIGGVRARKPVQSDRPRFTATPTWA